MRFGSVCSGIEAASVAWHQLGWQSAWLAEIEPFPCAVLAHHYPAVPNHGDMTTLPKRILLGEVEAPDVFCGGTPCQAFSVAGLRKSLDDARGNLSLTFCEIADAIDHVRGMRGEPPSIIFWENVPGVLSTADNAFGCFLAGLAGEDDPLQPPGGKWTNAGAVYGPQRAVAWRTLDAQYFGVAQRRRRVFVVASARNDFDPAAVLFEFDGVRRDSAPSREAREEPAESPALRVGGGSVRVCGCGHPFPEHLGVHGCPNCEGEFAGVEQPYAIANCLTQRMYKGINTTLDEGQTPVLAFDTTQLTSPGNYSNPKPGDPCHPLASTAHVPAIAVRTANTSANGHGVAIEVTHTLDGANGQAVAFPANLSGTQCASTADLAPAMGAKNPTAVLYATPVCPTLRAGGNRTGGDRPPGTDVDTADSNIVVAVGTDVFNGDITGDIAATMGTRGSSQNSAGPTVMQDMQVRRLTPVECERLQGFPDNYTAIPWRNKPADQCPDGPRYKALGNSWAVPVVRWIGERIARHVA